jgi:hypothetical protein
MNQGADCKGMSQIMQTRASSRGNVSHAGTDQQFLEYTVGVWLSERRPLAAYEKVG